ncbi:hypothetical protein RR46_09670 [Papilio xuthus]|uniref:Uncharacterized protein n=1 Tax=Papilio xuthus TaxID=66420 RepID=A0A194QAG6_PAPXU|nr:hypothetical protein RR46_09670 [Papilio xuthus]
MKTSSCQILSEMFGDILFSKYLLFLIISCEYASCNQLSRARNHIEYGPRSDLELIKNLDDKTYDELMNEVPMLKRVFQGNRKDESFQFNSTALPMLFRGEILQRPHAAPIMVNFDDGSRFTSSDSPATIRNSTFSSKAPVTLRSRWPTVKHRIRGMLDGRRQLFPGFGFRIQDVTFTAYWFTVYPHIISCYWCGLNDSFVPTKSICYSIWDSEDTRIRDLGRFFRARCHYYDYYRYYDRQIKMVRWYPATVEYVYDHGLKTCMFGPYMKGCFKRFVDVGPLYTARGCRGAFLPWRSYTRSAASHRLMRLEIVARGHEDVCVHSPEASLTPYSRAISLFVRYHVCVCDKPYCNVCAPLYVPLALPLGKTLGKYFSTTVTAMLSCILPLITIK